MRIFELSGVVKYGLFSNRDTTGGRFVEMIGPGVERVEDV